MKAEKHYDEVIAPMLAKVAQACIDAGFSMTASVEYERNRCGRTRTIQPDAGLDIIMTDYCAKTAPNVDAYIIGLARYCNKKGIPMGASIILKDYEQSSEQSISIVATTGEG